MLSKTLSCERAPRIDILANILTALGCRHAIELIKDKDMPSYSEPTSEKDITKFENLHTQLAESDST